MATRNKKSPDNTRKPNRKPIYLKVALALISLLAVLLVTQRPASTQEQSQDLTARDTMQIEMMDGVEVVAREAIVRFNTPRLELQRHLNHAISMVNASGHRAIGPAGLDIFHFRSKNMDTRALVYLLSRLPGVLYAQPNYVVRTQLTPNDTRFGEMWGLNNTGQVVGGQTGIAGADISAVQAWDVSTGSTSIVVGVIDTGVDFNHPDLAANIWSAPSSFTVTVGGQTITCPAGSHGFNAINNTCNPLDDNNHGTHTSGTIGARGNNGSGVAGVNWTTSIMGLKFLNSAGSGNTADAIECIQFAIQAKQIFGSGANVRVLSNSWGGGGFSQALLDAINAANSNDMLFVAAAGNNSSNNDTTPFFPANYTAPNVVAVAATNNNDQLASFSNFGSNTVHLGGPGVSVLSTTIGNTYSFFSGTSMATPHVSGAAALVLSVCSLDTAGLKNNLLNNVDPISSLSGLTITGGRLNVNRAIRACSAPPTPNFSLSSTPSSQTVTPGASASYTVTVTSSGGFTGTVDFSASGLPAGASASFNPPSVNTSGSSTMTVTTSASTPTGTYPLIITGTSGSLQRTTSVTLVVASPSADFSLSATPSSRSVMRNQSTTYAVTVTPLNGFTGAVTFSVTGLPRGASASFNPTSVTGSGTTTMTVTAGNFRGTFTLTIAGTSGSLQHNIAVTLTVTK